MYVSLVLFLGHLYLSLDHAVDPARAERDHARLGARGLGARGTTRSGWTRNRGPSRRVDPRPRRRDTRAVGRRSRSVATLCAAGVVAVVVSAAYVHHVLGTVEDWTMDKRFAIRGGHTPKDIAIVGIDERTLSTLGLHWPFPRRYHAQVIRNGREGRPARDRGRHPVHGADRPP